MEICFENFAKIVYWKKNDGPFIYQNLGLRRAHSFTRGVKIGPYSVARPQYLFLSPEYPPPPPGTCRRHFVVIYHVLADGEKMLHES